MFALNQLTATGHKRQWILMDTRTCLPLLYPLTYQIDHLSFRSLSTQSASLQAIKYFYEFWLKKYGVTFCYSFYSSGHDPRIAIDEMSAFSHYLENSRTCQSNVLVLVPVKSVGTFTNAARFRAIIQFISFLINKYVSPFYLEDSPKVLSRLASRLHARLRLCNDSYRTLATGKKSRTIQGFQSMNSDMVICLYRIITPCSARKFNPLNPFPSGDLQFRNFLIVRLLLNYGLRIGELLLLERQSIKSNIKGDKFSLIITTTDGESDPRGYAPSLKNVWANRVLELDKQDHDFLIIYIEKLRPKTEHDYVFTSTHSGGKPLSYNSVYSIFLQIDSKFSKEFPEYKSLNYFDSIKKLTPHVTRHTWAYLTLQKLYHMKLMKSRTIKNHTDFDFFMDGLMGEAKNELRLMGGWSQNSEMPGIYAKRFLSELANKANIHRIDQDNRELSDTLSSFLEDINNDY
ncbi:site-specific integrase [Pectobacterium punjabense]|uniref:site-specific integrase n=1 Tax=Pectobacterium punjabense TaxID=2108399 RepID=UPI00311F2C89